jgi:hypothetical protein
MLKIKRVEASRIRWIQKKDNVVVTMKLSRRKAQDQHDVSRLSIYFNFTAARYPFSVWLIN